ncbi:1-acyl-sn-glycerol-3-phosphate acyltransferase [bacterium]|nr:1-acyl-sn-glycerol-3-phosphate acyltransferase [bacterium]
MTRVKVNGLENYPHKGRLIVVANHTGVMETVMMTSFAPRQIEYLAGIDLPPEPQMAFFMNAYQFIPVYRGNVSLKSMRAGLQVLNQEGVLGIFPEGGIWEPAIRKAQSGVAWLSYHGKAPILPIGFNSTSGALGKALSLKRPEMIMNVGELIPPVELTPGIPKKAAFQQAAQHIMDTVWALIPAEDRTPFDQLEYETFELEIKVMDENNLPITIPPEYQITQGAAFSKILYRTTLINNFRENLHIDIAPLKNIAHATDPKRIAESAEAILNYLENENPYYFTYRYEQKEGKAMESAIRQIYHLAKWVGEQGYSLQAIPIRRYSLLSSREEIVENDPTELKKW